MASNMVVLGGLGNQMFQYAFALALRDQGKIVKLDTSIYNFLKMHNGYELDRVFGIKEDVVCKGGFHLLILRILIRFKPTWFATFDNHRYNKKTLQTPKHFICGYWQDERYFNKVANKVREVFSFHDIDANNTNLAKEMNSTNSVAMHVRRGDYIEYGMHIIDEKYYRNAVEIVRERLDNPIFYIFSDDEKEAERIGKSIGVKFKVININKGGDSYKDIFLMSQCKHNIIANSSFSWWGAWLNDNVEKIVVAPRTWDINNPDITPQLQEWYLV